MLVRIETEDGLVGWGEGGQYGPSEPVAACIDYVLAPKLLDMDIGNPEKEWDIMYAATRDFGQKGTYIEAISAIDIALWDLWGQTLKTPVHALIGGAYRDSIPAYATGFYYKESDLEDFRVGLPVLKEEAERYADSGFQMFKVKLGLLEVEDDYERLRIVRETVGPKMKILIDCNHAYNYSTALKLGRLIEPLTIDWIEEPVVPEDLDGYKRLRRDLNIPIAGGECEYTRYGFQRFLSEGCVDIAQYDVCVGGGLSEFRKIIALTTSMHVRLIPHVWGSGVALAAALHAIATIPAQPHTANVVTLQNGPAIEYDRTYNPLRDDLVRNDFSLKDYAVGVPQEPGLGIEIDESVLERYAY